MTVFGEWQDIATVPRNETDVLVYFQPITGRIKGVFQVAWINHHGETTPDDGVWTVDDNKHGPYSLRGYCAGDDTHWMPLPPPPEESSPSGPQGTEAALSVHDEQS